MKNLKVSLLQQIKVNYYEIISRLHESQDEAYTCNIRVVNVVTNGKLKSILLQEIKVNYFLLHQILYKSVT